MPLSFQLDVVTPEKLSVSSKTVFLTAPGRDGYFGVFYGHTPLVTLLSAGILTIGEKEEAQSWWAIGPGYAEVVPDRVTVLVEQAVPKGHIDPVKSREEYERATKELSILEETDPETAVWVRCRDFARACLEIHGISLK